MESRWMAWLAGGFVVASATLGRAADPSSAAAPPAVAEPDAVAADTLDDERLLRLRAEVLRAEDRRVIDDALRGALAHPDARLRAAAVGALGRIGEPSSTDALARSLADAAATVRAEAAFALGRTGEGARLDALVAAAADEDPAVRSSVALALGLIGQPEGNEALLRLLGDASPDVVVAAARAAANFERGDFSAARLIEIARGDAPEPRFAAFLALSHLSAGVGRIGIETRASVRALLLSAAIDVDPTIRRLAIEGLDRMVSAEESKAVVRAFGDRDRSVSIAALGSLCFPGAPTGVHLREALASKDPLITLAVIEGLGRLRIAKGAEHLQNLLLDERVGPAIRLHALRALDENYPPLAPAAAGGVRGTGDAALLAGVAEVLVRDDSVASVEAARRLIKTGERAVVAAALPAVGRADGTLAELLGSAPTSPHPELRAAAARAAGIRLARSSAGPEARVEAHQMIEQIWKSAPRAEGPRVHEAVVDAAIAAGEPGVGLVRLSLTSPFRHVRQRAIRHLEAAFGEDHRSAAGAASDLPVEHYLEILRWASVPRAAVVTVARPGFRPGRFTLRLDTSSAPLSAWGFARIAEAGLFDGLAIDDRLSNASWTTAEPPPGIGNPVAVFRDEPRPVPVRAGALLLGPAAPDSGHGAWSLALTDRPELDGRSTVFGRVVQNLTGVASLIIPGDRLVSVEVYAGDGSEPLPPSPSP